MAGKIEKMLADLDAPVYYLAFNSTDLSVCVRIGDIVHTQYEAEYLVGMCKEAIGAHAYCAPFAAIFDVRYCLVHKTLFVESPLRGLEWYNPTTCTPDAMRRLATSPPDLPPEPLELCAYLVKRHVAAWILSRAKQIMWYTRSTSVAVQSADVAINCGEAADMWGATPQVYADVIMGIAHGLCADAEFPGPALEGNFRVTMDGVRLIVACAYDTPDSETLASAIKHLTEPFRDGRFKRDFEERVHGVYGGCADADMTCALIILPYGMRPERGVLAIQRLTAAIRQCIATDPSVIARHAETAFYVKCCVTDDVPYISVGLIPDIFRWQEAWGTHVGRSALGSTSLTPQTPLADAVENGVRADLHNIAHSITSVVCKIIGGEHCEDIYAYLIDFTPGIASIGSECEGDFLKYSDALCDVLSNMDIAFGDTQATIFQLGFSLVRMPSKRRFSLAMPCGDWTATAPLGPDTHARNCPADAARPHCQHAITRPVSAILSKKVCPTCI